MLGYPGEGKVLLRGLSLEAWSISFVGIPRHLLAHRPLLFVVIFDLIRSRHVVRKLGQLGRCGLHSERIFLGIEILERDGIANKYVGELSGEASRGCNGLCLDALAHFELEATRAVLGAFRDVHRDCLRRFRMPRLEGLT